MSSKKRSNHWIWIALVLVGGSAFGAWRAGWIGAEEVAPIVGAPVEKKTLVISVVQRGNLASKDALSVKSEIEGQTTILDLIPEGTMVKPGDFLCELDVSELRDRRVAQEISVQNAEAAYVKAKAQFEIQESQNKSDIEAAERKLLFAQKDREKYLKGDLAQLLAQANEKIKLAEAEKAKAQNTYDWSKNLEEKGFLTKTELERDELDFQRAEVSLLQAQRALALLQEYDDPRKQIELEANVHEAERGLERARLQAEARLADYRSSLATSESKLGLEKEKLDQILEQIGKGRITAKQAGMVVYARIEGGGRGGNTEPIAIGTTVRERQEILSIPRTAGLIVEASVHESVLKQVTVGRPVKIMVDALRDQQFDGRVTFVALLADKGSWWSNPNQRLYRTEIQVLEPHPDMRPGMSCGIEILSEVVPDAVVVPLQSIFLDEGKTIAFVARGQGHERRPVKTGRNSQTLVEVLEGLQVGETVLLAPPAGFSPKAAPGSTEMPTEFPAAAAPGPDARGAGRGEGQRPGVAPGGERGAEGEGTARPRGEGRLRPDGGGGRPDGGGRRGGGGGDGTDAGGSGRGARGPGAGAEGASGGGAAESGAGSGGSARAGRERPRDAGAGAAPTGDGSTGAGTAGAGTTGTGATGGGGG